MIAILTATLLSLVHPSQEGPRYEAELLTLHSTSSHKEAGRINISGDYCGVEGPREFAVVGGKLFRLPHGSSAGGWQSQFVFDIDDKGNVYGAYSAAGEHGIYSVGTDGPKLFPISRAIRPTSAYKYPGFATGNGRIIFHVAPPGLRGHSQNCHAVQLRGDTLTYFQTASAGAQGSIVTCMTEKGEAGGILLFGTVSQAGNLQVTRRSPAVWTENNDLIPLETKREWKHSMVTAIVDRDLAYGEASLPNRQPVSVIWIKGKPSVTTGVYNKNLFVSHIAMGNPVGVVLDGSKKYAGILLDLKVRPLSDFVVNLPKNTILEDTMDVASDGSILAVGKQYGFLACFRLKPVAN